MEFWDEFYNQFQEDIDKSNAEDCSDSFEREVRDVKNGYINFVKKHQHKSCKEFKKKYLKYHNRYIQRWRKKGITPYFFWNMNLRITYEIMKEKMSLLVSKASEI